MSGGSVPSIAVLPPQGQKRPFSDEELKDGEPPAAKRQSKWSAEENALIVRLRGEGMKWDDISRRLPGRSPISCRLHYQNFLERRAEWTEEQKNRLARLYDRFKKDMWKDIAKELEMPWRAVEAMHWELGAQGIASRTGVAPFQVNNNETVDSIPPSFARQGHHANPAHMGYPNMYNPGYPPTSSSIPLYAPISTSAPTYHYGGLPPPPPPPPVGNYHPTPPYPTPLSMPQVTPMTLPRQRSRSSAPATRNRTASRGRRRTDSTSQTQPLPSIARGNMPPLAPAHPHRHHMDDTGIPDQEPLLRTQQLPPLSSIHSYDGLQYQNMQGVYTNSAEHSNRPWKPAQQETAEAKRFRSPGHQQSGDCASGGGKPKDFRSGDNLEDESEANGNSEKK